jgi:hypothetical protein
MFVSAITLLQHGFILDPHGGMNVGGPQLRHGPVVRSLNRQEFQRPQKTVNADLTRFTALGGTSHDLHSDSGAAPWTRVRSISGRTTGFSASSFH